MTRTAHQAKRASRPASTTQVDNSRRYRCTYTPRDALGHLHPSDTGAAPFVQFRAANATAALDIAHRITGCPVIEATRIEG
ncbi:hypothetical protein AB4142_24080 [Variovorax sp. 2RAF20]